MLPLSIFCIGGVVIYISRAWVILPLRHIHICACIDMFVYVIQSNFLVVLHLGYLFYFSPVHGLLYHSIIVASDFVFICLLMLYPCLLICVGIIYTIYSLVVIHLGNIVIHISCIWFVIPFSPSLLACMQKIRLTSFCFN